MSSRLSVLSQLQEYAKACEAGNESLKTSLWQITKLRRKQNRGVLTMEDIFSPDQIREELRARTMVRDKRGAQEPGLVSEAKTTPSSTLVGKVPEWESVDALEEKVAGNKENPGVGSATATSSSSGLRQRKNKAVDEAMDKTVTKMTEDPVVDEEEVLLHRDPLEQFSGVRPGDLKLAQASAKKALDSYILAATRAAHILAQIDSASKGKR